MAKEDIQGHMRFLADVCTHDVEILVEKEAKYKGSWKKRGGVGVFMMLARKWDRIENQLKEENWNVFAFCQKDKDFRENQIGDLRRYLMLVEAELLNLEKMYPDVTAKLEVKDEFSPAVEDGSIVKRWKTSQCVTCGEYYSKEHHCKGKCKCCGLFELECFCSAHKGECNSQFVKKRRQDIEEINKRGKQINILQKEIADLKKEDKKE